MQTAVATCDSLSVFMREMEKHPLLSKEEEYALAVRYYENEDLEAANKLVVSNLRFVVKIASEYGSYGFPMMDLVQEGSIGLMRAVKKFDPYKGYRLISYAVWWIRVRIQNHIMKFWSNVKIGTTQSQRKLFQRIEGAKRRLGITAARMEDDDISRLADHFGVNEEEISRMQTRVSGRDLSLSESPAGEDSATYGDMLHDPSDNQEQVLCELGFHTSGEGKSARSSRDSFREAGKGDKREVFLRTSEKAPRNSRGPWSFPGKGKADTGRIRKETQGIHVRKT